MSEKPNHSFETQPVCPWWLCFTFDNPIRRMVQNPERILKPYVKAGMKVLDVGPGMGYFTIPLARMVGDKGRVTAADLQPQMLEAIRRRATKAGVMSRIKLHQVAPDKIGLNEPMDFALAFWMVHEVPDRPRFIAEIAGLLKPGGLFLLVEPKVHVSARAFLNTVQTVEKAGLKVIARPRVFISNSVLFSKLK